MSAAPIFYDTEDLDLRLDPVERAEEHPATGALRGWLSEREAEHRFERKVSWGVECDGRRILWLAHESAPKNFTSAYASRHAGSGSTVPVTRTVAATASWTSAKAPAATPPHNSSSPPPAPPSSNSPASPISSTSSSSLPPNTPSGGLRKAA